MFHSQNDRGNFVDFYSSPGLLLARLSLRILGKSLRNHPPT